MNRVHAPCFYSQSFNGDSCDRCMDGRARAPDPPRSCISLCSALRRFSVSVVAIPLHNGCARMLPLPRPCSSSLAFLAGGRSLHCVRCCAADGSHIRSPARIARLSRNPSARQTRTTKSHLSSGGGIRARPRAGRFAKNWRRERDSCPLAASGASRGAPAAVSGQMSAANLAEGEGFEPPERFPVQRFSRPPP